MVTCSFHVSCNIMEEKIVIQEGSPSNKTRNSRRSDLGVTSSEPFVDLSSVFTMIDRHLYHKINVINNIANSAGIQEQSNKHLSSKEHKRVAIIKEHA